MRRGNGAQLGDQRQRPVSWLEGDRDNSVVWQRTDRPRLTGSRLWELAPCTVIQNIANTMESSVAILELDLQRCIVISYYRLLTCAFLLCIYKLNNEVVIILSAVINKTK